MRRMKGFGEGTKHKLMIAVLVVLMHSTVGKIPDAEIYINPEGSNQLYLEGAYGSFTSQDIAVSGVLRLPPSNDPLLCDLTTNSSSFVRSEDTILLVPRGECSFEAKTLRAQYLGAKGVLIYNTLSSRYGWNETANSTIYPQPRRDYECSNGQVTIDSPENFVLDPPAYNATLHDPFLKLDGPNNLCDVDESVCTSKRCLITEEIAPQVYTGCCAWDIHISMGGDDSLQEEPQPSTVAVFLTMEQGDRLASHFIGSSIRIQPRWYPRYHASSFVLWLLATFITAFASWHSAKDYRRAKYKLTHPQPRPPTQPPSDQETVAETESPPVQSIELSTPSRSPDVETGSPQARADPQQQQQQQPPPQTRESQEQSRLPELSEGQEGRSHAPAGESAPNTVMHSGTMPQENGYNSYNNNNNSRRRRRRRRRGRERNTTTNRITQHSSASSTELTLWHALLFVVMASCFVLLLFYFQLYTAVSVLYSIGCSGALSQVLFRPLYTLFAKLTRLDFSLAPCPKLTCCGFGEITYLDISATVSGYVIGITWLYVYFSSMYPATNAFYWITQDVMGACISVLFLYLMKLNSIKVATVLMVAIFVYDIFFVFISPYLFGESVMVAVATSGGPGDATQEFCTKYPDDAECRKGQPLPMALTFPRINDFRKSFSMLGLGDVVLPGLLIAFAARLDEAKRLLNDHTNIDVMASPRGGYLLHLVIAYAIGLLFASLAVTWMQRGQPALLYVVPACLGTLFWYGRHELGELWQGPRVMTWADRLVLYCDSHTFVARDAATVAEAEDEDDFDSIDGRGEADAAQRSECEHTDMD